MADTTSTAEVVNAIRETRARLENRLAQTADHVEGLLSSPPPAGAETRDGGFIGHAVHTIAGVGRTRRAWNHARRTGLLRRAAIGAATVACAAVVAIAPRRR